MKASEALVVWTPASHTDSPTCGKVRVGPLLTEGKPDWTTGYSHSGGAAYVDRRRLTGWRAIAMVFIEFNTIVVGDGIDPRVAHAAFLAIDEYAERISPDIEGARERSEDV